MTTHRLTYWVALAAAVFVLAACGGSEAGSSSDGGGGGASDSASYTDTRATVPVVELNETGPSAQTPTGPVMCSGKMCGAASGGMIPLVACCQSDNTCGLTFDLSMFGGAIPGGGGDGGVPCLDTAPGTPDPNCPSQSMAGFSMPGCCSRQGVCGVDLAMLSSGAIGCNSQLGFPGFGMGQSMNAPAKSCTGAGGDGGAPLPDASADATHE